MRESESSRPVDVGCAWAAASSSSDPESPEENPRDAGDLRAGGEASVGGGGGRRTVMVSVSGPDSRNVPVVVGEGLDTLDRHWESVDCA
jgi:hypothetical protein